MIWEIVLRYAISTWVKKRIPTYPPTYLPTYQPAVYMHDGFGASIGVAHSDLFIAARVYLVVGDGGGGGVLVMVMVSVVSLAWLSRWAPGVARVFENARTVQRRYVLCTLSYQIRRRRIINEWLIFKRTSRRLFRNWTFQKPCKAVLAERYFISLSSGSRARARTRGFIIVLGPCVLRQTD